MSEPTLQQLKDQQTSLLEQIDRLTYRRNRFYSKQNLALEEMHRVNDELAIAKSALQALNTKIYSQEFNVTIE